MTKLLYVTANPKSTEHSFSLQAGEAFLESYKAANPNAEIEVVDLYNEQVQEIDADVLSAWGKFATGEELSEVELAKVGIMSAHLEKYMTADEYVFVTPMWNFSFPARLKMFLDSVLLAGKTFAYTAEGPKGLMEGKKALHIQATGGVYTGTGLNFGDDYLRQALAFTGVTDYDALFIEGMAMFPEKAEEIKQEGLAKARELGRAFGKVNA
ncbi:NAD(P)H-dependent oxidoreductase [Exiguobacterium flavidum]|uniref:NAD(P)H-dependent oxidoreductase n=1 Tax=Exiguobacterium flavidum TaxID=2184695 RepID=UPI000DF759A5|nr:NAD(P)H-dependent oxidoreductase [Exiguobacterium flavidum]